jgi:hypothetical protein
MKLFAENRSEPMKSEDPDAKQPLYRGVDQASQVRWVQYFQQMLSYVQYLPLLHSE